MTEDVPLNVTVEVKIFSKSPLVLIGVCNIPKSRAIGPAPWISPRLRGRPYWLLLKVHWSAEQVRDVERLADVYHRHAVEQPEHRIVYLCNTPRELLLLQRRGIPSLLCNHNIFACERTFNIDRSQPKQFDAVYTARMSSYKRHELGCHIRRLGLIYPTLREDDDRRLELVKHVLPAATFINEVEAQRATAGLTNPKAREFVLQTFARNDRIGLPATTVAVYTNRARVGLCLSAVEGAMYASMEYLLCGLPVVSTPSRGGRDLYFDPEFCTIVPPDPDAIAAAVADLIRRDLSPERIRARTLAKVMHDRAKLLGFLRAIYEDAGTPRDPIDDWRETFTHTMAGPAVPVDAFLQMLDASETSASH
jgi:hypothetical protein